MTQWTRLMLATGSTIFLVGATSAWAKQGETVRISSSLATYTSETSKVKVEDLSETDKSTNLGLGSGLMEVRIATGFGYVTVFPTLIFLGTNTVPTRVSFLMNPDLEVGSGILLTQVNTEDKSTEFPQKKTESSYTLAPFARYTLDQGTVQWEFAGSIALSNDDEKTERTSSTSGAVTKTTKKESGMSYGLKVVAVLPLTKSVDFTAGLGFEMNNKTTKESETSAGVIENSPDRKTTGQDFSVTLAGLRASI